MAILLESTVNSLNFGRGGGSIASNTRFGCGALSCNSVGTKNTAVGYKTLFSSDKNGNTAAGHCSAAVGNSSGCVTAIGYMAGRCTNGISVSIGSLAGSTTTSERFVAVGYKAGCGISLAAGAVVVGREAGFNAGSETVSIGDFAGRSNTGTNSVFIGRKAGEGVYRNSNNSVSVGVLANFYCSGANGRDDSVMVGYNTYAHGGNAIQGIWGRGSVNNVCNCVYVAWTNVSDCRDKTNMQPLTNLGLNFIRKLRPVKYVWDPRERYVNQCLYEYGIKDGTLKQDKTHFGFLAQEMEFAAKAVGENFDSINYDQGRDRYSVSYLELVGSLVKSIQEINQSLDTVENKLTT